MNDLLEAALTELEDGQRAGVPMIYSRVDKATELIRQALSAPVGDGRLGAERLHVAHDPAAKPSEGGE